MYSADTCLEVRRPNSAHSCSRIVVLTTHRNGTTRYLSWGHLGPQGYHACSVYGALSCPWDAGVNGGERTLRVQTNRSMHWSASMAVGSCWPSGWCRTRVLPWMVMMPSGQQGQGARRDNDWCTSVLPIDTTNGAVPQCHFHATWLVMSTISVFGG